MIAIAWAGGEVFVASLVYFYLGGILMVFGIRVMTRLLFAVVSSLYVVLAIPWEERSLVEVAGDPYRACQRQVLWRLLPGVW